MIDNLPKVKVSELCEVIVDCVNKTAPRVDYETPYRMIRTPNIRNGNISLNDCRYVTEEVFRKWTRRAKVKKGDILLTREAPMGEVGMVTYDDPNTFLGQRIMQYRVNHKKIDSHYLLYSFLSPYLKLQFGRHGNTGSIVSHIKVPDCFEFEIPLPILSEQKAVSKVLSDLDAKIELNNKINPELEGMAKLIYDYWFVQFNFPHEFVTSSGVEKRPYKTSGGKMVYNEELKRAIPEGWEVKELQDIAKCIMGQSPKGESYNKDGIGTPLLNGPADYENGALKGRTYTTSPTRLCHKDDLVLCIRATIGNLVYSEQEFCLGRGVAAIRPNDIQFSELTYYLLLQEIERFKVQATGSIIKGITKDDLIKSKCFIPEISIIEAFHKQIKPLFDKIRTNKKQNQQLSSLRDWLLPMLMNGQVSTSLDLTKDNSLSSRAESKETKKGYEKMEEVELGRAAEGDGEYE